MERPLRTKWPLLPRSDRKLTDMHLRPLWLPVEFPLLSPLTSLARPDTTYGLSIRHAIQRLNRRVHEEFDLSFQFRERGAKGSCPRRLSFDSSRILNSPVRHRRFARPDGTDLAGGVVADSDDEVDGWRSGRGKLIPALAPQTFSRQAGPLQKLDGQWMHLALRKAARAES